MKTAKHHPPLIAALLALVVLTFSGCATRRPELARAPAAEAVRVRETQERPGLGTAWGEPRESWVEPAYFARAWENKPSAVGKLFYNDQDGVGATASEP
jgi:hypothetical protein